MIILIDNYDSFTYNLYQLIRSVTGPDRRLQVVRNDAASVDECLDGSPTHVVLSPGPGHPRDAGLSLSLPGRLATTPVLGVCLGHQALAFAAGASVGRAPRPTHGQRVAMEHDGSAPLAELPRRFEAALYHSLVVEREDLPDCMAVTAWSERGDIMGLRHVDRPHYGVQFHPESFMTAGGAVIVRRFLET